MIRLILLFTLIFGIVRHGKSADYNALVIEKIAEMPEGGTYARYRKDLSESNRFDDLYETMAQLDSAIGVGMGGKLNVKPSAAASYSFCSSATYLLFCEVVQTLQETGVVPVQKELSREISKVGEKHEVIHGKLDGIGLFGHWNADGPGTAVLFQRLGLGRNFSQFENAKPGDFMKIFWNDAIGKGESGHLVVYLGENPSGTQVKVWSSNLRNEDGSSGYGTMWIEKPRIKRVVFSRLENPENLVNWLNFTSPEKKSDYLIRIRSTGSTGDELRKVTGIVD